MRLPGYVIAEYMHAEKPDAAIPTSQLVVTR
jgi:hypothetical protein